MDNLNARRSQILAAFCMGFVFICVGIPFWWKTTEVYRADLPYSEIESLAENTKITTKITLKIFSNSEELTRSTKASFTGDFSRVDLPFVAVDFVIQSDTVLDSELGELRKKVSNGESISDEKSDILVVVAYSSELKVPKVFLTRLRVLYVDLPSASTEQEVKVVTKKVANFIKGNMINIQSVGDVVSKAYGARLDFPKETEFHMRKTVRPDRGYDLLFSLLCPEPDNLQASWDIEAASSHYLKPMLEKLGSFASFHVGSQVLYYSGLSVRPKVKKTGGTDRYYLSYQQLPHVVNPIESRLGAQMSPNPTLNFVIYMAKEMYSPLHIQLQDGTFSKTNTFLVPRWGAIMIKNLQKTNGTKYPRKIQLESLEFMEVFIAQLRSLLGLETIEDCADLNLELEKPDLSGITDFEVDFLIRARVAENIATAVHTLHSLAQLLGKIQNIVINDKIAGHVYTAVREIQSAKEAFANSELRKALNHSNTAFKESEIAFFDQTLLELLYFPEDQKFAIYIPLFLPISLPLLGSLLNAFKLWKAKDKTD